MVDLSPFPYVTYLATATEVSSVHAIMKREMRFSTYHGKPSPLTAYVANPESTRAAADQKRTYFRGGADWILEVMSSSGYYGKFRLKTSSTSDWGTQTVTPTRRIQ